MAAQAHLDHDPAMGAEFRTALQRVMEARIKKPEPGRK
jgi:hypothetical protein